MMSETQVRGYTVLKTAAYIKHATGEQEAKRILQGLSPSLQQALTTATPASWLPVAHCSELFSAVAGLAKGDEAKAKAELINCGEFLGNEATNTFLKLVMKILTPAMFAKKLPSLWSRDATGGKYDVEVYDDRIVCKLLEMEEFEHIGPISVGYVSFALQAMRKPVAKSNLHGWSLDKPRPKECWFELYWKT